MSTENFRRQLREETEHWWQEGLIDATLYQKLSERYHFSEIESTNSNRFSMILLGLGGILLGLGAITFVAANWQDWPRLLRVVLLLGLFFGVNGLGFYLWRHPEDKPRLHKLGHGLLLTGALILGADLGLMSQMFHQSGQTYELFLIWGLGVLAMAYGLRLNSLGVMSWILLLLSYGSWFIDLSVTGDPTSWITLFMIYFPLFITPLYLGLAHWCNSLILYGLWSIGFAMAYVRSFAPIASWATGNNAWMMAWALTLPAALLWVYHSRFWQWPIRGARVPSLLAPAQKISVDRFQPLGRSLAILILSVNAYFFSFRWLWVQKFVEDWRGKDSDSTMGVSLVFVFYLLMMVYGWWQWSQRDRDRTLPKSLWMKSPVVLGLLAILWSVTYLHLNGATLSLIGPILMNAIVFFLALAMLHDGLLLGIRRRFWGGMSLLVLGLISRMFEYNTGLILKAIVLSACGIGIIAAGLWFEYQTKPSPKNLAI